MAVLTSEGRILFWDVEFEMVSCVSLPPPLPKSTTKLSVRVDLATVCTCDDAIKACNFVMMM